MTPKEKAKELVDNYVLINETFQFNGNETIIVRNFILAKQCALILLDEIIKELTEEISPSVHGFRNKYWQEVKQEIEKL